MSRPAVVERSESIVRDLTFGTVRAWKDETGGLAIGYMPVWVPRELLHAQGTLPVGILGSEDVEIIRGDACYQSYICHIPRSTIELGLDGSLDCLDGMLFPATCDVLRNLSGIWKMRFPEKLSRYLDVPQNFAPAIGGRFLRDELLELADELAARGARPLEKAALRASIEAHNENRRLVRELYELRRKTPWKLATSDLYLVLRACLLVPLEEATRMLRELRAEAAACDDPIQDQARLVVTGSFCEQPPLGLLRTLERAGCYVVDDDFIQIHRFIRGDIATEGDPLDALVRAFLEDAIDCPVRYIGEREKGAELVARVRESGAEGVLFCAPSFCDPALLDQPMATRVLDQAGIPWTAFKYAENNGQFQVIREQAGTFADSIKLWSEA